VGETKFVAAWIVVIPILLQGEAYKATREKLLRKGDPNNIDKPGSGFYKPLRRLWVGCPN